MGFGQGHAGDIGSSELQQAQAAYGRAFNRFSLGRKSDTSQVLDDALLTLGHLRAAHPETAGPGADFVLARIADTATLLASLRSAPEASRIDVATGLLAVDFLLRAVHAQRESHMTPAACINCHSTHLVRRDGGTPEAPLYQCTDCGLTAAYPTA